jgi:hypothetical protein
MGRGVAWQEGGPSSDPVRLTLDIIRKELRRPEHPRLVEFDEGLWWLRDPRDVGAAKAPLSERVEWGIFSLLSTSGGIGQASFDERVSRLFRGPEAADAQRCRPSGPPLPEPSVDAHPHVRVPPQRSRTR